MSAQESGNSTAGDWFEKGAKCYSQGELEFAKSHLEKAVALQPNYLVAEILLSTVTREIADAEAVQLDGLISTHPQSSIPYLKRGKYHLSRGEHHKAITDFSAALNFQPNDAIALCDRGAAFFAVCDYEMAISDLTSSIQFAPLLARAYKIRGTAFMATNELALAIADLEEALRISPDYVQAEVELEAAKLKNTIARHTQAIHQNPKDAEALFERGRRHLDNDEVDNAIADLTNALHFDSSCLKVYAVRGQALLSKANLYSDILYPPNYAVVTECVDNAIADLTKSIDLGNAKAQVLKDRGNAYLLKSRLPSQTSVSAAASIPNVENMHSLLDLAIRDFTDALRLDPVDAFTYCDRASAYEALREHEKAASDYQSARDINPNYDVY